MALGFLFLFLGAALLGVGYEAARAGGGAWVITAATVVIGLWLLNSAFAIFRRARR